MQEISQTPTPEQTLKNLTPQPIDPQMQAGAEVPNEVTPPVKKNNKWLMIGGVVALVFLLLGGGMWWYQNNLNKQEVVLDVEKEINESEEVVDVASDEMEGWLAYQNDELGFKVMYPPSWYTHNNPPNGSGAPAIELKQELQGVDPNCQGGGCHLENSDKRVFLQFMDMKKMLYGKNALDIQEQEAFSDWVNRYLNEKEFVYPPLSKDVELLIINGLQVAKLRIVICDNSTSTACVSGQYIIYDERTEKIIFAEMYQNYDEYKKTFDQILSTFEFVDG